MLFIGRPGFGQAESSVGIFKVDKGKGEASRVTVAARPRLGQHDRGQEGLSVGDSVIISDMSQFDNTSRVRIKYSSRSTYEHRDPRAEHRRAPHITRSAPESAESTSVVTGRLLRERGDGNQPLIRLAGIKKVFFTDEVETHALPDIHLEIKQGEYVAIAGPSGCGKSTLLSILGLLDSPTDGEYTLDRRAGRRARRRRERARIRNREIGFIFQAST